MLEDDAYIHLQFPFESLRGKIESWVLRDLNCSLHSSQQTISTFSSKGWAKTFWASNKKLDNNTGILLNTFT